MGTRHDGRRAADGYDLWAEVVHRATEIEELKVLGADGAGAVVDRFTAMFGPGRSWRSGSATTRRIAYSKRDTVLAELLGRVCRQAADLVALDDSGEPHGVVHGSIGDLLDLLAMTYPFTCALSDDARAWLVVDTAKNVLLVSGDVTP
ncbi:MAG: hypothetical protein M3066_06335 [Actinomycetota bacterium]|nr:hypothetical protein [Actinomycetota bacterium]